MPISSSSSTHSARGDVRDAGDPAAGAGDEPLERPVVAADQHLERGCVDELGDPARVARALLDRDDLLDLRQPRDQRRRHVGAARLRVVVGHDRQAGGSGRRPRRRPRSRARRRCSRAAAAASARRPQPRRRRPRARSRSRASRRRSPAVTVPLPSATSTSVSITSRRSTALRLCASPIVPVPTRPVQPSSSSHRALAASACDVDPPISSNGVTTAGMTPGKRIGEAGGYGSAPDQRGAMRYMPPFEEIAYTWPRPSSPNETRLDTRSPSARERARPRRRVCATRSPDRQ